MKTEIVGGLLALNPEAGSHRQNSKDSVAGFPESGRGHDRENNGRGFGPTFGRAMAARPSTDHQRRNRARRLQDHKPAPAEEDHPSAAVTNLLAGYS